MITDRARIPHESCPSATGTVVCFCSNCCAPFDGDQLGAMAHEEGTGHSVPERLFCNVCHKIVAKDFQVLGRRYFVEEVWKSIEAQIEKVTMSQAKPAF